MPSASFSNTVTFTEGPNSLPTPPKAASTATFTSQFKPTTSRGSQVSKVTFAGKFLVSTGYLAAGLYSY